MRDICITGMGIVSALGIGIQQNLQALLQSRPGLTHTRLLNTRYKDELPVGELPVENEVLYRNIQQPTGDDILRSRTTLMGILALQEALKSFNTDITVHSTGLINATTVGGMGEVENIYGALIDPANQDYNELADSLDCADCTEKIARHFAVKDWITTISTACSSSANAIQYGARLIKSGQLDIAICGGTDALTRFTINGFNSLKNIDREPCKPFDANRNGLNIGEGAAYVILESLEQALRYNRTPIAMLSGYANYNEAFHPTAPSPEGEGAFQAMKQAIDMAGLQPHHISYINAHGTATVNNDEAEGMAMKRLFGENLPLFSSTKPFTGHTLAAAGAIEAVFSLLSIQHKVVFPNLNWHTPMPGTLIKPVTTLQKEVTINHILSNSFGFGGNNASLVFSKYA